ncbi:zinc finger protein 708 [Folsomia candida]|nr:zinc finger protein 708 [Folsomia candida]
MSKQVCLLCLQIFENDEKFRKTFQIGPLCKLLTLCHHNYKSSHPEFENNEICEFCDDCYPLFGTMEEIRRQISLLEQEIGSKMKTIKATILHAPSSSHLQNDGKDKILQIRDMLLRVAGENTGNSGSDEEKVQVKVEDEEGGDEDVDLDPLADVVDQFLDDDYLDYSRTSVEEEDLLNEVADDAAFCIIPSSQNKPTNIEKSGPRKRKKEEPPTSSKQIKLEPLSPTQSPPRRSSRKQAFTPKNVPPVDIVSKTKSASKESTRVDDYTLKIEHTDYVGNSDEKIVPKDATSHKCTTCATSYTTEFALNNHISQCHKRTCVAPSCTATFRSKFSLFAHLKTSHKGFCPYRCLLCGKKFGLRENALAVHMVMRHENGEKKLSCVKCGKKFCLEQNLVRHLKLHDVEGTKPLVCDVCDDRFENEDVLQKHLKTLSHGAKPFKCDTCRKGFNSRVGLESHDRTHKKEKTEKCDLCEAAFAHKISLQRHMTRAHSGSHPTHICNLCSKAFHLPVDLRHHLDRHRGRYQVKCDTCQETFGDQSTLLSHLIKVHGNDPYVCPYECGATFMTLSGYKTHKKVHEGVKSHQCDTCGACFMQMNQLTNHVRSHTGERPFPCPHCEQAFKTKNNLSTHVKVIHTPGYVPSTPHKCPHCDKAFQSPVFLEGHIRQAHTGERPFTCDQCAKGFAVKSALTLHLKTAHGVVPEKKDRLPRSKKDAFHHVEEDND